MLNNEVTLIKEDDILFVRWQMPVETLIKYRHILAECASKLKCSEDELLPKIQRLLDYQEELKEKIRIMYANTK